MKDKTIEELEKELEELKASNKASWDMYGSELCAGDMSAKEDALQDEIDELVMKEALRDKTIEKWKKIGLLEGLDGDVSEKCAELFKSQLSHVIDETPEPLQSLLLDDDLLLAIIGGDGERVTVRKGRRDIQLGRLLFIGSKDETLRYEVEVSEVRYVQIINVGNDVIEAEGFDNWHDFYEDMKKFYPDLDVTDEVTVIYFETADVKTQ